MGSALNWFEIPVTDMARAKRFYSAVLQSDLREDAMNGMHLAVLPYQDGVGGALIQSPQHIPSAQGTIVYLNAGDDLDGAIARVEAAGGQVSMGRTLVTEQIGSIAIFLDSEGNRVAFHSRN